MLNVQWYMNLVGHEIKFEDSYITDVFYVYNKAVDKLKDPNYDGKVVHFLSFKRLSH